MKKIFISILTFVLFAGLTNAQVFEVEINFKEFKLKDKKEGFKEAKSAIKKADGFYQYESRAYYEKAIPLYLEAIKYNPNNAELNFKIGFCYLQTLSKMPSLQYLDKALELKPEVSFDIHYQLGKAYHYNYMFDEAIKHYSKFKNEAPNNVYTQYSKRVMKKIKECQNGAEFQMDVKNVMILNIDEINTEFGDYSPLISADESVLIFTSRRSGSSSGEISKQDGQFFEDIYISVKKDGNWQKPKNMGKPLNSKEHDATVGLSADGQKLFIYRDQDIYFSELQGNLWSKPKKMPKVISSKDHAENSACFSADEKTIYFVRGKTADPNTSNGDLYYSKFRNGEWQPAKKLGGSALNTKYDEDGIYLHPDGRTLYFSSKGHNSMGGYDIFKSVKADNGRWSKPENMGIPVNSPDDDIYFVMAADGRTGYYSSIKPTGRGATDLYKMVFVKLDKPLFIDTEDNLIASLEKPVSEASVGKTVDIKKNFLTIVKGTITDAVTKEKLKSKIEISDNDTGEKLITLYSNQLTGKYLTALASGKNYGMAVTTEGYLFHSENFNIEKKTGYQEIIIDIELMKLKKGSKVVLKNIFFDTDKYVLKPSSNVELARLTKILKDNPDLRIEISGHTDSQGSNSHNITLSKNRAKAVVDYLVKAGINQSRLESRGASSKEPIDTNKTKEGRAKNRRVQFEVL